MKFWLVPTSVAAIAISVSALVVFGGTAQSTSLASALPTTGGGTPSPSHAIKSPTDLAATQPAGRSTPTSSALASINLSSWNTYLTDSSTAGKPWNADGTGVSGLNPWGYDSEYFQPSQTALSGSGVTVTATPNSSRSGYQYVSGVLTSYNHATFDGGYIQVEAKMPDMSTGAWPSLWLLPAPGNTQNDEIDIFEGGLTVNGSDADVNQNFSGFIHTDGQQVGNTLPVGTDLSKSVHTYAISWVPGQSVTWYLDGHQVTQVTSAQGRIPTGPMEMVIDTAMASNVASSWHTVDNGSGTFAMQVLGVQYRNDGS